MKTAALLPAGIVTDAGTGAAGDVLERETTVPPGGAFTLSSTVTVSTPPGASTWLGLQMITDIAGVRTVTVAFTFFEPFMLAVKVTLAFDWMENVVSGTDALVCPDGTVIVVDETADVFDDATVTAAPWLPAAAVRVTVHAGVPFPPVNEFGLTLIVDSLAAPARRGEATRKKTSGRKAPALTNAERLTRTS